MLLEGAGVAHATTQTLAVTHGSASPSVWPRWPQQQQALQRCSLTRSAPTGSISASGTGAPRPCLPRGCCSTSSRPSWSQSTSERLAGRGPALGLSLAWAWPGRTPPQQQAAPSSDSPPPPPRISCARHAAVMHGQGGASCIGSFNYTTTHTACSHATAPNPTLVQRLLRQGPSSRRGAQHGALHGAARAAACKHPAAPHPPICPPPPGPCAP